MVSYVLSPDNQVKANAGSGSEMLTPSRYYTGGLIGQAYGTVSDKAKSAASTVSSWVGSWFSPSSVDPGDSTLGAGASDAPDYGSEFSTNLQDTLSFIGLASKSSTNERRMATKTGNDPDKQTSDCAWYNIPCKVSHSVSSAASSTASFISSTLTKALVIIVVVGLAVFFLKAWAEKKGAQAA